MGTVVLSALVIIGWIVGVTKLLLAAEAFLTRWGQRRRENRAVRVEEQRAEARAAVVAVAVDTGDRDALLYALGLVDPVIEPGLNLLDEAELVAAYADPSFGPADIVGGRS